MASNQITTTSKTSVTPFSEVTLSVVARWRTDLSVANFAMPHIPKGQADQLRQAARELRDSITPASPAEIEEALITLRTTTIVRREHIAEAQMTMKTLIANLQGIPLDIIRAACTRYIREPGERFFPRSPGELLRFTGPLMAFRTVAAHRLALMATHAQTEDERAEKIEAENRIPPDEVAEANALMRQCGAKTRYKSDGSPTSTDDPEWIEAHEGEQP